MTTLINELKIKINKFYQEKNYSELEKLLESLKSNPFYFFFNLYFCSSFLKRDKSLM